MELMKLEYQSVQSTRVYKVPEAKDGANGAASGNIAGKVTNSKKRL